MPHICVCKWIALSHLMSTTRIFFESNLIWMVHASHAIDFQLHQRTTMTTWWRTTMSTMWVQGLIVNSSKCFGIFVFIYSFLRLCVDRCLCPLVERQSIPHSQTMILKSIMIYLYHITTQYVYPMAIHYGIMKCIFWCANMSSSSSNSNKDNEIISRLILQKFYSRWHDHDGVSIDTNAIRYWIRLDTRVERSHGKCTHNGNDDFVRTSFSCDLLIWLMRWSVSFFCLFIYYIPPSASCCFTLDSHTRTLHSRNDAWMLARLCARTL